MNYTSLPAGIPILLVDDRPENLLSLEALLSDEGYKLVRAMSGNEALLQTLRQDFALVLLDVQMPQMDGFETAELMRVNPKTRNIPIIFVTAGMKDLKFQFKGYDTGAVDYLAKPIEPVILKSKVRIFADLYHQRHEIEHHKNNLEELVQIRTAELRRSAEELQASNEKLLHEASERQRMEAQIRQTQKMDIIGQLAGGVAHDFNNMLTAILGSAELMERHIKDNSPALNLLGTIQRAAGRSADLTGQLLAFSRKGEKYFVRVYVDKSIHDVISLLDRTIDRKITLETRLTARNNCVIGDPTLLQNALLNLSVNARDAMPEGGVITFSTANVELDSVYCQSSNFDISPGAFIEISISDNGVGMTKEIIAQVFEPFFTTKGVGKGTGLGLAAVYNMITDMHGCITVASEPGIGTIFKLYLPLSETKRAEAVSSEEPVHGTGGILFVDDEEIIRSVGKAILEELGYKVFLAEDGVQALELYAREKQNIVLVILDMVMPIMNGKEALLQLIKSYPEVRVLISSGFNQEGAVSDLLECGAKGFIQKPYSMPELCKAVVEAMQGGEAGKR